MPEAAVCPQCGAPIPEADVIAMAPVCRSCGVVLVVMGGSLGLTGVYGAGDAAFTKKRVEADLEVHRQHQERLEGAIADCHQKLQLPLRHYANLPKDPQFLSVENISAGTIPLLVIYFVYLLPALVLLGTERYTSGQLPGFWAWFVSLLPLLNWLALGLAVLPVGGPVKFADIFLGSLVTLAFLGPLFILSLHLLCQYFVNGGRPAENDRRKRVYEEAHAAAMTVAGPIKKAADHRLQMQIRDSEAAIEHLKKSEAKIRQQFSRL